MKTVIFVLRSDRTRFAFSKKGGQYNLSTGRSSLGRSILSIRFSGTEKSGLDENRTSEWLVVWPPGGVPPESGLASSLAGVVPCGASTKWCGSDG
jgi:hypothetical protein